MLLLETILSPFLKVSFETTNLILWMQNEYLKCCFGGKMKHMNNRWALTCNVRPSCVKQANGYRCLSLPSNCFGWELNSNAGRVGSSEKEMREWNYLWILRCTLGQPFLCDGKYQVPVKLSLIKQALRHSHISVLVRAKNDVWYNWNSARNEQMCSLNSWETQWCGLCYWHAHPPNIKSIHILFQF